MSSIKTTRLQLGYVINQSIDQSVYYTYAAQHV